MGYGPITNNYNDLLQAETGRILPEFRERGRLRSWWASIGGNGIPSQPWRDEWGDTLSRNILERTIPSPGIGSGWQIVQSNGTNPNASNNCASVPMQILNASTLRTAYRQQQWLDSDVFCVDNVRTKLSLKQDIMHVVKNLSQNVADQWEEKNRYEYALAAQNHVVFNPQLPIMTNAAGGYDFPAVAATSPISQLYLDRLRVILKQNDAGYDGGAYAKMDGNDVFAVVMSTEMQQALFQLSGINNGVNNGSRINWDQRYAEPSRLLKAFGVNRSYMGWFHIIDDKAPRFNLVNGVYVQQAYYVSQPTTKGARAIVNPDYYDAQFELVIPFIPTVVTRLTPKSFTSMGSGSSFKAWDYMGTPQWMNYFDKNDNPHLTNGYWEINMQAGYLPEMIDNGFCIMCARPCNQQLEMVTCPGGVSGSYSG